MATMSLRENSRTRHTLRDTAPSLFPMPQVRIAPRYPVHKPAIAEYGGDKYPCIVRDLSLTGAAVEFADPINTIPIKRAFTLIMPDDGLRLACRIVWQRGYRMGVVFD
jgi:PilZ domain